MTEPRHRRRQGDSPSNGSEQRSSRRAPAAQVAQRARRALAEITGLTPEGVTEVEQYDDGTWNVTIELLELSRVPETNDIIGSYEVEVDEDGRLIGYRRVRRYARSHQLDERGAGGLR
jgi:Gas vesicle synthesis protein GvpO